VGYVVGTLLLLPELGAAVTVTLTIAGQQLVALLIDRRGLLGLPRRELHRSRVAGVVLLAVGAAVVQLAS
nr:DMT family transporter [Solirubrobacterales bacterium]